MSAGLRPKGPHEGILPPFIAPSLTLNQPLCIFAHAERLEICVGRVYL